MIKTAEDILNIVKEEKNVAKSLEASSFDEAIEKLLVEYKKLASENDLVSVSVNINGGVENDGITLALESNFINLPLRYKNQLAKLISAPELEINTYYIIEEQNITRSNLFIEYLDSLDNFLNNNEDYAGLLKNKYEELKAKTTTSQEEA